MKPANSAKNLKLLALIECVVYYIFIVRLFSIPRSTLIHVLAEVYYIWEMKRNRFVVCSYSFRRQITVKHFQNYVFVFTKLLFLHVLN